MQMKIVPRYEKGLKSQGKMQMTQRGKVKFTSEKNPLTLLSVGLHSPEGPQPRGPALTTLGFMPAAYGFNCLLQHLKLLLWLTSQFCLDDSQNLAHSWLSCEVQPHSSKCCEVSHWHRNSRTLKPSTELLHHNTASPLHAHLILLLHFLHVMGPNLATLPGLKPYNHHGYFSSSSSLTSNHHQVQ